MELKGVISKSKLNLKSDGITKKTLKTQAELTIQIFPLCGLRTILVRSLNSENKFVDYVLYLLGLRTIQIFPLCGLRTTTENHIFILHSRNTPNQDLDGLNDGISFR